MVNAEVLCVLTLILILNTIKDLYILSNPKPYEERINKVLTKVCNKIENNIQKCKTNNSGEANDPQSKCHSDSCRWHCPDNVRNHGTVPKLWSSGHSRTIAHISAYTLQWNVLVCTSGFVWGHKILSCS